MKTLSIADFGCLSPRGFAILEDSAGWVNPHAAQYSILISRQNEKLVEPSHRRMFTKDSLKRPPVAADIKLDAELTALDDP